MKTLLGLLLVSTLHSNGQYKTEVEIPVDSTGKIVFSDVIERSGIKKQSLFSTLRTWAATESISKTKNIQITDSLSGELDIKYSGDLVSMNASFCVINFSLTLYVKDGKYKYIFRNFMHEGCNRGTFLGEQLGKMASIGALENILITNKDRVYYDHVLKATKGIVSRLITSMNETTMRNNEKNF